MKNGYGFGKFQQIRVYVYIIKSGDIYGCGERNDSQIRVAPPRNNTHTIAFHYWFHHYILLRYGYLNTMKMVK